MKDQAGTYQQRVARQEEKQASLDEDDEVQQHKSGNQEIGPAEHRHERLAIEVDEQRFGELPQLVKQVFQDHSSGPAGSTIRRPRVPSPPNTARSTDFALLFLEHNQCDALGRGKFRWL